MKKHVYDNLSVDALFHLTSARNSVGIAMNGLRIANARGRLPSVWLVLPEEAINIYDHLLEHNQETELAAFVVDSKGLPLVNAGRGRFRVFENIPRDRIRFSLRITQFLSQTNAFLRAIAIARHS